MTFGSTLALLFALADAGAVTPPAAPAPAPLPSAVAAQLLRVRGPDVVDGRGRPVLLRGVAFGNEVWSNTRIPRKSHDEVDYQRVAAMGMNAVRFYLNHKTFDSPEGWTWLDDNITWAKKNNVYLILNMHVPPGGFQSLGNGKGLWDQPAQQQRLVDLWVEIARHTRGEPTIAGFDLLNEPVVTREPAQWHDLATRIAAAIRAVDPEHMLFVERLNAVAGRWEEDADRNFFTIPDANTVYEFHFYKPFHFTHQSASWVPFTGEDVRYPDTRAEIEWFLTDRKVGTDDSPKLPPGDSPWTFYPGAPFKVDDPTLVLGKPVLVTNANSGTVYFDDLVLEELTPTGTVKREIWRRNLTNTRGWYFWNPTGGGGAVPGHDGHGDEKSIVVAGTRGEANLGSDVLRFHAKKGATYRLSGWMRGKEIPPTATCQIRLDFYSARVPVQKSDRAFVAQELDAYVGWGRKHNVPLFLGEWGTIKFSFDGDRGGLRWVADMLDLMRARKLHFAYHAYHEDSFGIYRGGPGTLPDPANANGPLIELFTRELAKRPRK